MLKGRNLFLKTIDWYIIKKVLLTYFVAIALVVLIIVAIDLSSKIDDFIDKKAPLRAVIMDYYFYFIPVYINMLGHLFFFVAVVFVTSRLTARSETISILGAGISYKRFLRPFVVSAVVISIFGLYLGNFTIPEANIERYKFESQYYREKFVNNYINIHFQTSDSTEIYVHHFDNTVSTGYNFTKEIFSGTSVKKKICADEILYDSINDSWFMNNYSIRTIDGKKEELIRGGRSKIDLGGLKPDDFNHILRVDCMNFSELNKAVVAERMKGTRFVVDLLIERYQRLLNPIAFIILTLIGVSLCSTKKRGGMGINLAVATALAFTMILLMKVCKTWANNGDLSPFIAATLPLVLYFGIAIVLIHRASK